MAVVDPPELRRLRNFWEALPNCPHGCARDGVYESPSFRVPTPDDTIDDQVSEIIARCERVAGAQMERHRAEHDASLALAGQARRVEEVDRAAAWGRIRREADVIAEHLMETMLPADLRTAGMRIEWAEGE